MYYLRGFTKVQMYEASRPRWREGTRLVQEAKKDFLKIREDLDPNHPKATRAVER